MGEGNADTISKLSIKELKAALTAEKIDFSHCREKQELQSLLRDAPSSSAKEDVVEKETSASCPFEEGGFVVRKSNRQLCWVEFVADGDALCHMEDGSDSILPADEFESWTGTGLPGPVSSESTFEAARSTAFETGRLLVVSVLDDRKSLSAKREKTSCMHALVLASEEVSELIQENALFWRGYANELRAPQVQQLAPNGTPSLAMVLPLARDAMRVLSHPPATEKDGIIASFIDALEKLDEHKEAAQARLFSETAFLREEQDAEFAAALAADQEMERSKQIAAENGGEQGYLASTPDLVAEQHAAEAAKRKELEQKEIVEEMAKKRRVLADEFLAGVPADVGGSTARLVLRLPSGERVERVFGSEEVLSRVFKWAECCPFLPEAKGRNFEIPSMFKLTTSFPSRQLCAEDSEKTLKEVGLTPSAALLLIDNTE